MLQLAFQQMEADIFDHLWDEEIMDECCGMCVRQTLAKQQPLPSSIVCSTQRTAPIKLNSIICPLAPHCARLLLDFAGGVCIPLLCHLICMPCLAVPKGLPRFEVGVAPAIATVLAVSA
ncbi:hypothetical protein TraAM80_01197 [Trypanosoma rangeli]|uniref:Uncharacterized protein n=1 Tax=Trypanosoma rangeli TaxID=5698 RepID=A0A3R7KPK8_TRYRA|nr:uncharacterized protein TraAM80_01197 [Trypanosoma rangeli]RNF11070.1 hypothetical protein TraAM80_01197 [Trypanosoma rangeli]|eukprot:RNF11070.1 hypothetical protein TraAM80_01197 [Trypanosoma rangeli]